MKRMILKKRLLIVVVITMMLTTVSLCGCGEKDKIEDPIGSANVEGAVVQDEELEEEPPPIVGSKQVEVLLEKFYYKEDFGSRLYGEIQNKGETWVNVLSIKTSRYDDEGYLQWECESWPVIQYLEPGQKSPFVTDKIRVSPPNYDELQEKYTWEVIYDVYDDTEPRNRPIKIEDIQEDNLESLYTRGSLMIEFRNVGDIKIGWLEIVTTFYGYEGRVVGYDEETLKHDIFPNQVSALRIYGPTTFSDYLIQFL